MSDHQTERDPAYNPRNPLLGLVTDRQFTAIREALQDVADNWPAGTELGVRDLRDLSELHLQAAFHDSDRPTAGVDLAWTYICDTLLIFGTTDIYGPGFTTVHEIGDPRNPDGTPYEP